MSGSWYTSRFVVREELLAKDAAVAAERQRIREMVEAKQVPVSDEWITVTCVDVSSYRTQTQAEKYARVDAELRALGVEHVGIEARVVEHEFGFWVEAKTTEEGAAALRQFGHLPLRDSLKACWKKGCNPRVFDPFLPRGTEEELGLDYFGNDLGEGA